MNGNMIYSPLYAQVQSGKTANQAMEFYKVLLEDAGIDNIEEMAFNIQILDGESFMPLIVDLLMVSLVRKRTMHFFNLKGTTVYRKLRI